MSPDKTSSESLPMRALAVIFKVTDECNAQCRFCSVGESRGVRVDARRIGLLAERLSEATREWRTERVSIALHGGEPTLLGPELLELACTSLAQVAPKVTFSIQTNLLKLGDELWPVIEKHQIRIGTSVDPLTAYRSDRTGSDSYPRWLTSFLRLSRRGIAPGAIFVVTRAALGRELALVRFAESLTELVGMRFGLQLNPLYVQGQARHLGEDAAPTPEQFGTFLVQVCEHWQNRGRPFSLTPIEQLFGAIRDPARRIDLSCTFQGRCWRTHVGIDASLNVSGCGRRLDSGAVYGNLEESSLMAILAQSAERRAIEMRTDELRKGECAACGVFELCHGGCPDDACLSSGSVRARSHWCASWRMLVDAIRSTPASGGTSARRAPGGAALGTAAPTPRSSPPRGRARSARVTYDPGLAPTPASDVWLLPREGVDRLRFDSPLRRPDAGTALRLWLRSDEARKLVLFEDLVQHPGVELVLFEPDGLEQAANVIAALRGRIRLDLASLLAQAQDSVMALLERFLCEPNWSCPIEPFAAMLARAIGPTCDCGYRSRWGDRAGAFSLAYEGERIPERVSDPPSWPGGDLANWVIERRDCLECIGFDACGGQLLSTQGCTPAARALVDRVMVAGREIRELAENATRVENATDR